jgi:hypothetical protein
MLSFGAWQTSGIRNNKNTDLFDTLHTIHQVRFNKSRTAEALFKPSNTVNSIIRQIEELAPFDLSDERLLLPCRSRSLLFYRQNRFIDPALNRRPAEAPQTALESGEIRARIRAMNRKPFAGGARFPTNGFFACSGGRAVKPAPGKMRTSAQRQPCRRLCPPPL